MLSFHSPYPNSPNQPPPIPVQVHLHKNDMVDLILHPYSDSLHYHLQAPRSIIRFELLSPYIIDSQCMLSALDCRLSHLLVQNVEIQEELELQ